MPFSTLRKADVQSGVIQTTSVDKLENGVEIKLFVL